MEDSENKKTIPERKIPEKKDKPTIPPQRPQIKGPENVDVANSESGGIKPPQKKVPVLKPKSQENEVAEQDDSEKENVEHLEQNELLQEKNATENVESIKENTEHKKAKPVKQKPVKLKKSKSLKLALRLNRKLFILIALGIVLVAGAICAYLFIPRPEKLDKPEVYVNGVNGQVVLSCDEVDCEYYAFLYKNLTTDSKELEKRSNENQVMLSLTPGKYQISVKCCKKNDKYSSEVSDTKEYEYFKKLETPVVQKNENGLVWQPVKNAKEYWVYYGAGQKDYVVVPSGFAGNVIFNYSENFGDDFDAGLYNLYVRAIGDETKYYSSSELSNVVEYRHEITLMPVYDIKFYADTEYIEFKAKEETKATLFKIEVSCGSNKKFSFVYDAVNFKNLNLVQLGLHLNNNACLASEVKSITITAISNSEFVNNSTPVTKTI